MESSGGCSSICSASDHDEQEELDAVDKFITKEHYLRHVRSKLAAEVQQHVETHKKLQANHGDCQLE